MATHSSVLAWRITGTGKPGGLLSMGSHRVRHDWSDLAAAAIATIILYSRQQKRHRCIEQSFGLCGRGWEWDDLGEWHWNIYYHMWNESPVQVRCMIQNAWGWCTGMTQRDGMGREMGGRFRMGNTCTPMADSSQYMAKPIQYCKVISLQLK